MPIPQPHVPAHQETPVRGWGLQGTPPHPGRDAVSPASGDKGRARAGDLTELVGEQLVAEELGAAGVAGEPDAAHIQTVGQRKLLDERPNRPAVRTRPHPPVDGERGRGGGSAVAEASGGQNGHAEHIEIFGNARQFGAQGRTAAKQAASGA